MSATAQVLVLDDGELDDVCELLTQLGARVKHLRGGEIPDHLEPPSRLLVTTPRRASLSGEWGGTGSDGSLSKICIVEEDSNTLRAMLRRIGFDLLIRRPFHPYALRLVLLRSLYRGEERRAEERLPIGYEISVRSGLRRRTALLADLSIRGCRLLSSHAYPVGSRVTLQLPKELAGGKPLTLQSRVIRSKPRKGEDGYEHTVALSLDKMGNEAKRRLFQILREREPVPSRLTATMAADLAKAANSEQKNAGAAGDGLPAAAPGTREDRRKAQRVQYDRELFTLGQQAGRTLMGRDLSTGGMRVEPGSGLAEGDVLKVALYGAAREEPFIVRARVVRDAGEEGLGLAFQDLKPAVAARLEALVAGLPAVESLQGSEGDAMGSIVSEILERVGPEDADA